MTKHLWSIREMCAEFGVSARTLRFYEAKALIAPIRRRQKRLFTRHCRARLRLILRGKRFGFSLEDIRQILDLYDVNEQGATRLARTCARARERLAAMEAQRAELEEAIAEFRSRLAEGERRLAARDSRVAVE